VFFMIGMITAFMAWCSIGLLVIFLVNSETKTPTETIVLSLFFPLIFINFMLEYTCNLIDKRFSKCER